MDKELEIKKMAVEDELKKFFPPEFINRVDDIVFFNSLKEDEVNQIVKIELSKLTKRLSSMNYKIEIGDEMLKHICEIGFDEKFGARPIKRAIQSQIEDFISDEILKGNLITDIEYTVDYIDGSPLLITKDSKPKRVKRKKETE
jgi:ATP-dependent Clp protease ATP-binding subunit ClpC